MKCDYNRDGWCQIWGTKCPDSELFKEDVCEDSFSYNLQQFKDARHELWLEIVNAFKI